ncbi:MAG TPA: hypothetical protein VGD89_14325 [Flavipsychrobacter sp.]
MNHQHIKRHSGYTFLVLSTVLSLLPSIIFSQQFVGLPSTDYSAIHQVPLNPAWVNSSDNGTEFMAFSFSALAGTNAYQFKRKWVLDGFNGKAREGKDYFANTSRRMKHMWANFDIMGPAVSFKYKEEHHIGVYTRMRQLYRGGNFSSSQLGLFGDNTPAVYYDQDVNFKKAGFSVHNFSEIGFSYGRILRNDEYHIVRAGVTVKYLMGFVAGSVYTNELTYRRDNKDTAAAITGDITALYTYNATSYLDNDASNDFSQWFQRAGKAGLGLDIGVQYEYHPNGTPNEETPYLYSIAASITDIGGIGYVADRGSNNYTLTASNVVINNLSLKDYEGLDQYMDRQVKDSLITAKGTVEKFRMGLPTAFRVNTDWNLSPQFNIGVNVLLNMKGNGGDIYRPAYVNYFNITPTYGNRKYSISAPFSLIGYQNLCIGAAFRYGPFYIGSSSLLSSMIVKNISSIDAYAGLVFKFKKTYNYYTGEGRYNRFRP